MDPEVGDNDLWQRAVIAAAVVSNDKAHANEQMDKIIHFVEDMYVAPVVSRELEILSFGEQLFQSGGEGEAFMDLNIPTGERSLAEAEGMGAWEDRHARPTAPSPPQSLGAGPAGSKKKLPLDEARALARSLRNKREWER